MRDRHVFASSALDLSPAARWTLYALCDHAQASGLCWPRQQRLAELTGQAEVTVKGHVADLTRRGYIDRVRTRKANGHHGGYLYRVNVPGNLPVDPDDLPRWAGDVEIPEHWKAGSDDAPF